MIVSKDEAGAISETLSKAGEQVFTLGEIKKGDQKVKLLNQEQGWGR